jgi:hypothetical protein
VIPPSYLRKDVPAELDAICARALKTSPRRRFGGCEELADSLDRFLQNRGWQDGSTRLAEYMDHWFASDFAKERDERGALRPLKSKPPSA